MIVLVMGLGDVGEGPGDEAVDQQQVEPPPPTGVVVQELPPVLQRESQPSGAKGVDSLAFRPPRSSCLPPRRSRDV